LVELNAALRRFVPQEFVQLLGKKSIVDVSLGDQIQGQMTILTSDIRSFTTLSETMTPEENFSFLNAYLGRVSPIIRQHKGIIDKYIGDAIMALFPEKPEQALQAAIAIRQAISRYRNCGLKAPAFRRGDEKTGIAA
jgi:two-component system sensor histidine kinase ChiS